MNYLRSFLKQYAYACGIPLGQRGRPPQRICFAYPLGQTFVGCKKNKFWIGSVVNHWNRGILLWTVGDRSHRTFEQLWQIIKCWHSFWYVTDGWKVYPMYIQQSRPFSK